MSSARIHKEANQLAQEIEKKCKVSKSKKSDNSSSENNNLEECVDKYSKDKMTDRELDNSSRASCSDTNSNDEGYELSSSGRSSASDSGNEQRTDTPDSDSPSANIKVLNPHNNHFPHKFVHLTEELRVRFLKGLEAEDEEQDLYDVYDIEQLRLQPIPVDPSADNFKPEQSVAFRWISRFISGKILLDANTTEGRIQQEVHDAHGRLSEFLKFRKQFTVSHVMPDQFAREFYVMSGIFPFGVDKSGVPVLYLRARIHRRWSAKLNESFQRYVAWQIDMITKSHPEAKSNRSIGGSSSSSSNREKDGSFGICFDCLSVSYSCLDMDFLRYLVKILVNNYPTYCRYALCVDLPWLFRSVWKLVRSWLPEEAQNSVQLITSKQLTEFIDEDQIPNSIQFSDLKSSEKPSKNKHVLPKNFETSIKSIKEFVDELNLGQNEVKQFVAHVEKIKKEYEQLGAI